MVDAFPSTRAAETARKKLEAWAREIVLWAADLPESAFTGDFRLEEEEDSAGGRILTSECLSKVEPLPPQNGHTATFRATVVAGVPYRLWVRMKTNEVCGATRANLVYVQAVDAIERSTRTPLSPGGPGWITLRSDGTEGWAWVGRDHADPKSTGAWIVFKTADAVIRVYEGNDRVGIDQLVLSPQKYFANPPVEVHLPKSAK